MEADLQKMFLLTKNEIRCSRHSKVRARTGQTDAQTDATEYITMPHSRMVITAYHTLQRYYFNDSVIVSVESFQFTVYSWQKIYSRFLPNVPPGPNLGLGKLSSFPEAFTTGGLHIFMEKVFEGHCISAR